MTDPVTAEWNRCRHYIEAALDRSPHLESIEDVERRLGEGTYMLWTGDDCALVTQIMNYPSKRVMEVVHGGGNKREIIGRLGPALEEFAVKQGCDSLAVIGRRGWIREGEKAGWHLGFVVMMKALKQ